VAEPPAQVSRARILGLSACALLLLVLTGAGLYEQQQNRIGVFVAVALVQGAVYFFAAALIWRGGGSRRVLVLILMVAAMMRLAVLFAPPYLSSDIYRYIWDGRVLAAGINPYRYIPNDPQLEALRDPTSFAKINRNNYAPTIYPPLAEAIFLAVTRFGETVTVMKAAMLAFDALTIALLLRMLIAGSLPATRVLIYAWHPLPVWEFAGSGHIDAAVIAFVVLALWMRRRFPGWAAGLALAAGVLTKLYPAVLFPALWRRWDWRMPLVFALAIVLAYLPFLGVGWKVLGFLPGYAAEEGFTAGGAGFYLWSLANAVLPIGGLPGFVYVCAVATVLAGLGIVIAFRPRNAELDRSGAALLATAFILLLSPHYPWYFAWLIAFACLLPSYSLLWLTASSFLLYVVPVGSQLVRDRNRLIAESAIYLPFAALAAIEWWLQRRWEPLNNAEREPR
jgi:alpha-1,6-mannosyltransferase